MSNLVLKTSIDDKVEKGLGRIETQLKRLNKTQKQTQKTSKSLGATMAKAFQFSVMYKAIGALVNQLRAATQEVLKFDLAMKQIQGITGTTGANLLELSSITRKLGLDTEFATSEVAKAALEYTKMGFSVADVNKMIPTTMDLVTASGAQVTEVLGTVGQTLKAYGLEAAEAERVTNVIQTTVSRTALNFTDFGESMKFVAPIAKAMGVSVEETSALIGTLGDMGLKGSLAGTALKNMFTNIAKPSDKAATILKKYNVQADDLAGILQQLKKGGAGIKELATLFNLRALPAAAGLSSEKMEQTVRKLNDALINQDVQVKKVAETIRTSLSAQLQMLSSNLQQIPVNLFEIFKTMNDGRSVLDVINEKLRNFNEWLQSNPDAILFWAATLSAAAEIVGKLVIVVGEMLGVLIKYPPALAAVGTALLVVAVKSKLAAGGITTFGAAMKGLMAVNPVIAIGVAVGALALALNEYSNNLIEAANNTNKLAADMSNLGLKTKKNMYEDILKQTKAFAEERERLLKKQKSGLGITGVVEKELKQNAIGYANVLTDIAKSYNVTKTSLFTLASGDTHGWLRDTADAITATKNYANQINGLNIQMDKNNKIEERKIAIRTKLPIGTANTFGFGGDRGTTPKAPKVENLNPFQDMWNIKPVTDYASSIVDMTTDMSGLSTAMDDVVFMMSDEADTAFDDLGWFDTQKARIQSLVAQADIADGKMNAIIGSLKAQKRSAEKTVEDVTAKGDGATATEILKLNQAKSNILGLDKAIIAATKEGISATQHRIAVIDMEIKRLQDSGTASEVAQKRLKELADTKKAFSDVAVGKADVLFPVATTKYTKMFGEIKKGYKDTKQAFTEYSEVINKSDLSNPEKILKIRDAYAVVQTAVWDTVNASVQGALQLASFLGSMGDMKLQRIQEEHDLTMKLLEEQHSATVAFAGADKEAKMRADLQYAKDKKALEKTQLEEKRKAGRLKKSMAISEIWINTAVGISSVWAQFAAIPALAAGLSAVALAMGAAQTVQVAKQKFAFGTQSRMATGNEGSSTDLIPAMISPNEYIIGGQDTEQLGGFYGVQRMISDALVGQSGQGGNTTYNFNAPVIGEKRYVRGMMNSINGQETTAWSR